MYAYVCMSLCMTVCMHVYYLLRFCLRDPAIDVMTSIVTQPVSGNSFPIAVAVAADGDDGDNAGWKEDCCEGTDIPLVTKSNIRLGGKVVLPPTLDSKLA